VSFASSRPRPVCGRVRAASARRHRDDAGRDPAADHPEGSSGMRTVTAACRTAGCPGAVKRRMR
jgi:hypothetical protein